MPSTYRADGVDVAQARADPAVALLSVVWHGRDAGAGAAFPALVEALRALGPAKGPLYREIVLAGLPEALRVRWEEYMSSTIGREYRSKLFREIDTRARAEGKAEGAAQILLSILEARGIGLPPEADERIRTCTDLDLLETWSRRAVIATTIDDVIHE